VKTVLVLGSAGQIGAGLAKKLTFLGYRVVEFDLALQESQDLRIRSPKLDSLIFNSDFVFFLAFDVGGSRYLDSYQNSFEFIQNNMEIMVNTFLSLKRTNANFIFTSSQMADMNYSNYGLLKLIGEKYTQTLKNGRYVRFWNVYGLESAEEKFHVISDFIKMAKTKKVIEMRTNGEESRDFLHVDDCCDALIYVMENFDSIDSKFPLHIASFRYTKIIEIANIVAKKLQSKVLTGTKIDNVQLNAMNNPNPAILKFWQPKIDLEKGIESIIASMDN
jgi:nucleoside-diphosphate-sugar epimerase